MSLAFHSLQESDQPEVIRFIAQIQNGHGPGFNWSASQLRSEFKSAHCFVLKKNQIPVAFASIRELPEAFELNCIAVNPDLRNQGFGKIFLARLIGFASSNASSHKPEFWLEVHEKNWVACRLYSEAGFQVVGRRENYYGSGENALLMSLSLS